MIRKNILLGVLLVLTGIVSPAMAEQKNALKLGFGIGEGFTYGYERLFAQKHGVHISYGGIGLSFDNGINKQSVDFGGFGLGYRYYFSDRKEFGGFYGGLGVLFKTLEIKEKFLGIELGTAKADLTIPYVELGYRLKFKSVFIGFYAGAGSAEADFEFDGTLVEDDLKFGKSSGWTLLGIDIGYAF